MNDDMSTESVEAALAMPQNQQQQVVASSLAPTMQQPASPASAADNPSMPNPMENKLSTLFNNAMKTVRQTIATKGSHVGMSPSGTQNPDAISRIVASLRGAPAEPTANVQANAGQPTTGAPAQTLPGAKTAPAPVAQMPQVTTFQLGGGRSSPAYEYGGNAILIDGDVDTNDPVAVRKYMDDTNNLIDMINSAYEEV